MSSSDLAGAAADRGIAFELQVDMFREAATAGGLDMQLVYYRGLGECRASRWISNPEQVAKTTSDHVQWRLLPLQFRCSPPTG